MTFPALPPRAWFAALVVPLLWLAGPARAASELTWTETEQEIEAAPLVEKVEADFRFTNQTDHPVTIVDIQSSCGCTVAELEKKTYAPKESGRLRVVFTIEDRTGRQDKKITVRTSGARSTETVLSFRVTIPVLYELKPLFVSWSVGEPLAAKVIRLQILRPDIIRPASVESRQADRFSAALESVSDQTDAYTIKIVPTETNRAANGSFQLNLAASDGKSRAANFYAIVRPAENKPRP